MSAAGAEEEAAAAVKAGGGELLYCGGTSWDTMGRKAAGPSGNLVSPTRLRPLVGVDIRFVASGCTSCHCVALDVEGRCYTWGRNEKGQLGHGDTRQRSLPTVVSELLKYKIVRAGSGRNHTVVVTADGKSFSFGLNKHGQLGLGSMKNEIEPSPLPSLVSQVTNAVCGADFTVWLSSVEGSSILTAGLPQYGQLGHGTDNEYNTKDSSVRLAYEPQPRPRAISTFSGRTIVKVACGTNHTVAVDSNGFVYTWGFGGYGRLGHREQKDEWVPRLVEVFQRHNVLPPTAVISAGSASSACTAGGGQLYMWGKMKTTGDDWMYPKPVMDLSGWNIRCMDSGNMHHVIGADDSCISWGHAQYGELGYGPLGQKSSANPKKVDILDGMHVTSVACGWGLSLIVVDRTNVGDRLDKVKVISWTNELEFFEIVSQSFNIQVLIDPGIYLLLLLELEIYEGETPADGTEDDKNDTAVKGKPGKGSTDSSANSKKRKKHDDSSDSGDSEDESENSEEDANGEVEATRGRRAGKASSRGRGRGAKKRGSEVSSAKRGRGRPPKFEKSSGCGQGRSGRKGKSSR